MKHSILYVDDEIENLRSFYAVFRRDYDIVTSSDPEEALELITQKQFDLILSDQRMPGITGVQFLTKAGEILGEKMPKSMIISGYSPSDIADEAFDKLDLFAFISKPWKEEYLREKMNEGIELTNNLTAQSVSEPKE